ncbi:MAG: EAL domain-containing protein [Steroidobacteraceae bacterium]
MDTTSEKPPRWVDNLCAALVVYAVICAAWMLAGLGGERIRHFVGLLAGEPACLMAGIVAVAAARRSAPGASRTAWWCLSIALALYFVGQGIASSVGLQGRDPFPGIPDFFYVAYYLGFIAAVTFLIRGAAARVQWMQLALDAAILVFGFGAFFWFLVIRPAAAASELDVIKKLLTQTYMALDSVLLLAFGVLLLASAGNPGGRRVRLLLLAGFAMSFIGDVLWSITKISPAYLPGALEDVLYIATYAPLALAGREQMRAIAVRATSGTSNSLTQSLPYAAMLSAFLVLVYVTRGDIGGPTSVMTVIVFALSLLVMVRQALALREDALTRERRAAGMVERRYASLIANASDAIMIVAVDGTLQFASPASKRTLGLSPEEIAGRNLLDLWAGDDGDRLRTFLAEVAATPRRIIGPVELRVDRYVLEMVGSNLTDDPAVRGLALNFRDISERKELEQQLRKLAFHDSLTLLANRSLFRDRVQHALSLAQRDPHPVAVMFLDLDNFKNINDSFGHDAGDRLLQAVAQRLVKSTRSSDTVARLGGDEFAILLEGTASSAEVQRLAAALIEKLDQPFLLSAQEVRISASIGVAFWSVEADAEALLSKADIAMYQAKTSGKNRFAIFQPHMQESLRERLRLEMDITRALANEEFFIEYQPIVDLGTRSLLGVEALVRWQHPHLGVLMPGRFIQVAEESGQIVKLDRWVLTRACQEMRGWRNSVAGGSDLRIAVNVSGRHLQHGGLEHDVAQALQQSGLEPGNLVIELTESTVMHDTEANLDRLRRLKALGVRLAIDDFGTGYSSLSYLHRFPIDILKIDHSFVGRLTSSQSGPELARAVITLAAALGLDTVAEGVEHEPQVAALLDLGCVAGQGFLFARSSSLEQLSESTFVARRNALWTDQAGREDLSPTGRFNALKCVAGAA